MMMMTMTMTMTMMMKSKTIQWKKLRRCDVIKDK